MTKSRTSTGLLLLVVLAFAGFLLISVPSWLAANLEAVSNIGPSWLVYVYVAVVGTGALLLLAASASICWRLWSRTRTKRRRREERNRSPSQLTRTEKEREVEDNLATAADLKVDFDDADELRKQLAPLAQKIEDKRQSQSLEIVAFGAISSGKSSLLNALAGRDVFQTDARGGTTVHRNEIPWPGIDKVLLVDTPGLGEIDGAQRGSVSADAAKDADLVLVVVDGPLREWEHELLQRLGEMEKRVLICLNKEDWYNSRDRRALIDQISEQVKDFVRADDIVAVRSRTTMRERVRVLTDGSEREEEVEVPIDIAPLAERMMGIVASDGRDLLLANLLLQSRGLVDEARQKVQDALDQRARALIDTYMWGAGGAAALSPFPVLDLVAGCAISTKMVVDLGQVYRQEVDLNTAVTLLGQLGKNLLAILGVSAVTPAVTAAIASLLKTVPGAGTIAGGMLQGTVQALITRWIGGVFMEYFKNEMQQPEGGLTGLARREWERLTTMDSLRRLVQSARKNLLTSNEDDD